MSLFNKTWKHRRWFTVEWSWRMLGLGLAVTRMHCTGTTNGEDGWRMAREIDLHVLGLAVVYRHVWKQEWLRSFRGEPKQRHIWAEALAEYERHRG